MEQNQTTLNLEEQKNENLHKENTENEQQNAENNVIQEQKDQNQQQKTEVVEKNDGMDDFFDQMDNPINITQDEKDNQDDDEVDPKLLGEWDNLMKGISQGFTQEGGDQNFDFQNMMSEMMKGLTQNVDPNNQQEQQQSNNNNQNNTNNSQENNIFKQFETMVNQMEKTNAFDSFANKLLYEFMDKEILYDPMKEAQQAYVKYLNDNKETISKEDYEKYYNQQKCIDQIIETLDNDVTNKDKLIQLFENMQDHGNPPEAILKSMNQDKNVFNMMSNFGHNTNQQQTQQSNNNQNNSNQMPNLEENCNIF